MGLIAYDVVRANETGIVVSHHGGRIDTEGPWLIAWSGAGEAAAPELIVPAHVVLEVAVCAGKCRVTPVPDDTTGDGDG